MVGRMEKTLIRNFTHISKFIMKHAAFFIALLLISKTEAGSAQEVKPDKVVTYKKIGDVELKLELFFPPEYQPTDKRPAIVFFFGGGWTGGKTTQFHNQSRYLASRGMVAICAEYRIRSKHQTSPKECVMDGKSAMRWVRSHAAELGIDPDKLAAGGGSAGGQVAAATGTLPGLDEDGEQTTVSCRPNALVLFNPVFDNGPEGYGHSRVKEYWQEFSPMHNIDEQTPPTIVFLGTKDKLIPVATAQKYKQLMEQAGGRCDLHLYEGAEHGFFNVSKYAETLMETDKFLASLGYLKGEPDQNALSAGSKSTRAK
jgi:acetyl esterase/lipase